MIQPELEVHRKSHWCLVTHTSNSDSYEFRIPSRLVHKLEQNSPKRSAFLVAVSLESRIQINPSITVSGDVCTVEVSTRDVIQDGQFHSPTHDMSLGHHEPTL